MSKKTVIILIIIVFMIGMGAAAYMGRSYVSDKVISKFSARMPEALSVDGKLASILKHPFCYEEIVIASQGNTRLTAKNVCLESSVFVLMSDDPSVKISCESVVGTVEHSDIKNISGDEKKVNVSAYGGGESLKKMTANVEVKDLRLSYAREDMHLSWNGNATASL